MSSSGASTPQQLDLEQERAALARLDDEARRAHFATDAASFLAHDADPILLVREGDVISMAREELTRILTDDMRGATYHEWDPIAPPIVHVSRDASMAWVISHIRVRRTKQAPDGTTQEERFIYAGISAYEKRDGAWVRAANASTFAEGEQVEPSEAGI
jgi:hypothetical protein